MVFGEMNSISNKAAQTLHTRENCIGGGGGCFMRQGEPRALVHTHAKSAEGVATSLVPVPAPSAASTFVLRSHGCCTPELLSGCAAAVTAWQ